MDTWIKVNTIVHSCNSNLTIFWIHLFTFTLLIRKLLLFYLSLLHPLSSPNFWSLNELFFFTFHHFLSNLLVSSDHFTFIYLPTQLNFSLSLSLNSFYLIKSSLISSHFSLLHFSLENKTVSFKLVYQSIFNFPQTLPFSCRFFISCPQKSYNYSVNIEKVIKSIRFPSLLSLPFLFFSSPSLSLSLSLPFLLPTFSHPFISIYLKTQNFVCNLIY